MTVKYVNGNIFDTEDVDIFQIVNVKGVWGAGLAFQIKKKYPEVFDDYEQTCDHFDNSWMKLTGLVQSSRTNDGKFIHNGFAMPAYRQFCHYSFAQCLKNLWTPLRRPSVSMPHLPGCGLAKGNEKVVKQLIEDWSSLTKVDVTVWKYDPKRKYHET